jgi:hypothetical protein
MVKKPLNATALEQAAIVRLQRRIDSDECPDRGSAPPLDQKVSFRALPISEATLRGLEEGDGQQHQQQKKQKAGGRQQAKNNGKKQNGNFSNKKQFWTMTDIQNACIPHALKGRDILGAARTGR